MKKNKTCLFLNFNTTKHPFFETALELMKINKKAGNKVYVVGCDKNLRGYCCSNCRKQIFNNKVRYCTLCKKLFWQGCELLKLPKEQIFKLKNVKKLNLPEFNSINDVKNFTINGLNIGFGVASTAMTYTRDHMFNPKNCKKIIDGLFKNAYTVAVNTNDLIKQLNPDEVYLFNGRYAEYYAAVEVCKKSNTDFYVYESGSNYTRYSLIKNNLPHNKEIIQKEVKKMWDDESVSYEDKLRIINEWNFNKRNNIEKNWRSFTKTQEKGKLPVNFDKTKENITIFNSSMDESAIFEEYKSPIDANDNNIIKNIIEHYKDSDNMHFYLRVHPHLKNINNTQMRMIKNSFCSGNYKNITVIMPEEDIDSYAIMENSDKVLVFNSTMGVEAAFAGKPTILAGQTPYDNLNCTYNAETYDKIYAFLDNKNLSPKPKENTYPYLYWLNKSGILHTYYKPKRLFRGKIFGIDFFKVKLNWFDYIKYAFFM